MPPTSDIKDFFGTFGLDLEPGGTESTPSKIPVFMEDCPIAHMKWVADRGRFDCPEDLIDMPCVDNRQKSRLLELLFYKLEGEGTSLFALMDGAREPRVLRAVAESGLDHECLYAGDLDPEVKAAAPYIVRLVHGSLACERLIFESWGRQWGMFISARIGLRMVRRHLRTFLRVQTEDRRKLLFRYYDPRVLRVFLPTCDPGQLWKVFGPIQRFDMEAPDAGRLMRFRLIPEPRSSFALRTWTYPLSEQEEAADDRGPALS
jgi:hypothetical protein